jgi:hypothetical protein
MGRDVMTTYDSFSSPETTDAASPSTRMDRPRGFWTRITNWLSVCADYYEAAALYEEFNALSDAELARRGIRRANLARDVCEACDRGPDQPSG